MKLDRNIMRAAIGILSCAGSVAYLYMQSPDMQGAKTLGDLSGVVKKVLATISGENSLQNQPLPPEVQEALRAAAQGKSPTKSASQSTPGAPSSAGDTPTAPQALPLNATSPTNSNVSQLPAVETPQAAAELPMKADESQGDRMPASVLPPTKSIDEILASAAAVTPTPSPLPDSYSTSPQVPTAYIVPPTANDPGTNQRSSTIVQDDDSSASGALLYLHFGSVVVEIAMTQWPDPETGTRISRQLKNSCLVISDRPQSRGANCASRFLLSAELAKVMQKVRLAKSLEEQTASPTGYRLRCSQNCLNSFSLLSESEAQAASLSSAAPSKSAAQGYIRRIYKVQSFTGQQAASSAIQKITAARWLSLPDLPETSETQPAREIAAVDFSANPSAKVDPAPSRLLAPSSAGQYLYTNIGSRSVRFQLAEHLSEKQITDLQNRLRGACLVARTKDVSNKPFGKNSCKLIIASPPEFIKRMLESDETASKGYWLADGYQLSGFSGAGDSAQISRLQIVNVGSEASAETTTLNAELKLSKNYLVVAPLIEAFAIKGSRWQKRNVASDASYARIRGVYLSSTPAAK